ncbi:MAG: glyceraldehyde 3-phosphate dehydrogenase NAD-binding domain-containing protein [Patescibacteria group bacterium]
MTRVAINGFGRIGRQFLKAALEDSKLKIVAINDLGDLAHLVYLLKYDSVYRTWDKDVSMKDGMLIVGGKEIAFLQERDPTKLPWKDLDVDVVVESTGAFESYEKARVHITAGAKRVVLSAPAKDDDGPDAQTVLMGVNEEALKTCTLSSNGSCTTNSASPVMQILTENLGIKKAFLTTVHGYTATQSIVDSPTKGDDYRRGRAAAQNIVPSSTGAAIAVARAIGALKGKFDGISMRVPVIVGSISQISFVSERGTTVEEINGLFEKAEKDKRWKGLLKTTRDQIVSSDIIGEETPAIIDLSMTRVVDGDLCSICSWYDNEMGYTHTLVDHVIKTGKMINN